MLGISTCPARRPGSSYRAPTIPAIRGRWSTRSPSTAATSCTPNPTRTCGQSVDCGRRFLAHTFLPEHPVLELAADKLEFAHDAGVGPGNPESVDYSDDQNAVAAATDELLSRHERGVRAPGSRCLGVAPRSHRRAGPGVDQLVGRRKGMRASDFDGRGRCFPAASSRIRACGRTASWWLQLRNGSSTSTGS